METRSWLELLDSMPRRQPLEMTVVSPDGDGNQAGTSGRTSSSGGVKDPYEDDDDDPYEDDDDDPYEDDDDDPYEDDDDDPLRGRRFPGRRNLRGTSRPTTGGFSSPATWATRERRVEAGSSTTRPWARPVSFTRSARSDRC